MVKDWASNTGMIQDCDHRARNKGWVRLGVGHCNKYYAVIWQAGTSLAGIQPITCL